MRIFITSVMILLLFSVLCQAQSFGMPAIYSDGGISVPASPNEFSKYWKTGKAVGIGFEYPLTDRFSICAQYHYYKFGFNLVMNLQDGPYSGIISIDDKEMTSLFVAAKYFMNLRDNDVLPYYTAGLGIVRITDGRITAESPSIYATSSENSFGLMVSGGVEFYARELLCLFFEGTCTAGFTEPETTIYFPVKFGVKYLLDLN